MRPQRTQYEAYCAVPAGDFRKTGKLLSSEIRRILIAVPFAKRKLLYPEGTILESVRPHRAPTLH